MAFQTGCGKVKKEKRSDFEYSYFREWGDSLINNILDANIKKQKEPRMIS